jgi:hypothetical protein
MLKHTWYQLTLKHIMESEPPGWHIVKRGKQDYALYRSLAHDHPPPVATSHDWEVLAEKADRMTPDE